MLNNKMNQTFIIIRTYLSVPFFLFFNDDLWSHSLLCFEYILRHKKLDEIVQNRLVVFASQLRFVDAVENNQSNRSNLQSIWRQHRVLLKHVDVSQAIKYKATRYLVHYKEKCDL